MVVAEQVSLPFSTILVTTVANSKPHNSMIFYSHQDANTSSPMQFTISQFAERSYCLHGIVFKTDRQLFVQSLI